VRWARLFLSMLPKEAIEEFKRIYKAEYGEEISDKEASDLAVNLVLLFKRIYRPLPKQRTAEK